MDINRPTCLLIADFTLDTLAHLLRNDGQLPAVDARVAPFGQVSQVLLNGDLPEWRPAPDVAVVWTRPQSAVPSFARLMDFEQVPTAALLEEVDQFTQLLLAAASRVKQMFVPAWTMPATRRGLGMLEMRKGLGASAALAEINLRLASNLEAARNVFVLDASRWQSIGGAAASNPKLWFMGKIAFSPDVLKEASADIKAALRGIAGKSRKLVILDLDDTLWGGIVGEVGWQNIVCGGHDPAGEAIVEFQRRLKALTRLGVVLGIVSKNDESVALEALRNHPEMVLRPDDFAGWKINWNDKAQNIEALAEELNLGLDSAVFIDDNPVERGRVREALPQLLVPEWPGDKMLYAKALEELRCFDKPALTKEDAARQQMYVQERRRGDAKQAAGSLEQWLHSLELTVTVEPLNEQNLKRAAQLLNKTNQMNLATRRMGEAELLEWSRGAGRRVYVFRVADRFGDAGLTGIVSTEVVPGGREAVLSDYLISCRVMGRGVEETMLHAAVEFARSANAQKLVARHLPTPRNAPCLQFFREKSQFRADGDGHTFVWDVRETYPLPAHVRLEMK